MMICLLIGTALSAQKPVDAQFFKRLLQWRTQFERVLEQPDDDDIGYTSVYSEMLGGAHGDALYPLGSAFERYVLSYDEGNGGSLIYERRHGKKATVDWYIPFVAKAHIGAVHGTIEKYLKADGFVLAPRKPVSARIRKQLWKDGYFASYSYHPMMGGYANVVQPDGECTATVKHPNVFIITPDEKRLLLKQRPPAKR
ncbi:MAG TPA: hypothetical protein VHE55_09365 [Fimbriimonadaceae bacterium]|nr:hypothetical protein [Fimbriimonadaceae bacterium]